MLGGDDYLSFHFILSALPSFTSLWSVTVGSEGLRRYLAICTPLPLEGLGEVPTHPAYTAALHNVPDNREDTYIHRYNRGPSLVLSVHCEGGGEQGGCLSGALTLSLY